MNSLEEVEQNIRSFLDGVTVDLPNQEIIIGSGKQASRLVYHNQQLTSLEQTKLNRLKSYLQDPKKNKGITYPNWDDGEFVKFLYGVGWKTRNSAKAVGDYIRWSQNLIGSDYRLLFNSAAEFLVRFTQNRGLLYIQGRDHYLRPIFVMSLEKFNFKQITVDQAISLVAFILEFTKKNMQMPGAIENWTVLVDMAHKAPDDFGKLKKVIDTLQNGYRGKLYRAYVLRAPRTFNIVWRFAKTFLNKVTTEKVNVSKQMTNEMFWTHINPHQIEQKYGGLMPDRTIYWPPVLDEENFIAKSDTGLLFQKIKIESETQQQDTHIDYEKEERRRRRRERRQRREERQRLIEEQEQQQVEIEEELVEQEEEEVVLEFTREKVNNKKKQKQEKPPQVEQFTMVGEEEQLVEKPNKVKIEMRQNLEVNDAKNDGNCSCNSTCNVF